MLGRGGLTNCDSGLYYLVQWRHRPLSQATWEHVSGLFYIRDMIVHFENAARDQVGDGHIKRRDQKQACKETLDDNP